MRNKLIFQVNKIENEKKMEKDNCKSPREGLQEKK